MVLPCVPATAMSLRFWSEIIFDRSSSRLLVFSPSFFASSSSGWFAGRAEV